MVFFYYPNLSIFHFPKTSLYPKKIALLLPYGSSTTSYQPTDKAQKKSANCRPVFLSFFPIYSTNPENIFFKIYQILSLKKVNSLIFSKFKLYPFGNFYFCDFQQVTEI